MRNLRMSTLQNLSIVCMQCLAQLLIRNTTQMICTITWLDSVASSMSSQSINPWLKPHCNPKRQVPDLPGIHVIVPLINAAIHTLQTQHHCMQYIKKSVNFFNHNQSPADVCNQPVYALTKEIQRREKVAFGSSSYFSLFRGLHMEKAY